MNESNSNGNGRDGGGNADADFIAGPEDETVVIVSDEYTARAIARLSNGLRGAAAVGDGVGTLEPGAKSEEEAIAKLDEFADRLKELGPILEGARRSVLRHRMERAAKLKKANEAKETTP